MTPRPDIPDEPRSFEDDAPPPEPERVERNGHGPAPSPQLPVEPDAKAAGRFGTLNQSALNRRNVRDRDR